MNADYLSYAQLFSFQVLYDKTDYHGTSKYAHKNKQVQWYRAILVVDFRQELFVLTYKERMIECQQFNTLDSVTESFVSEAHLTIVFSDCMIQFILQNAVEKSCLQHLLECVRRRKTAEDAVRLGLGIAGLDAKIMKTGLIFFKTTSRRKQKCFLVLVPGKLFMFKHEEIMGRHARYVTSLLEAIIVPVIDELEFRVMAPNSKQMLFVAEELEELNHWLELLHNSTECVNYAKCYTSARDALSTMSKSEAESSHSGSKEDDLQEHEDADERLTGAGIYYGNGPLPKDRRRRSRLKDSRTLRDGPESVGENIAGSVTSRSQGEDGWTSAPVASIAYYRTSRDPEETDHPATTTASSMNKYDFNDEQAEDDGSRFRRDDDSDVEPRLVEDFRELRVKQPDSDSDLGYPRSWSPMFAEKNGGKRELSATDLAIRARRRFYDALR